jgi:hypothetical protein
MREAFLESPEFPLLSALTPPSVVFLIGVNHFEIIMQMGSG